MANVVDSIGIWFRDNANGKAAGVTSVDVFAEEVTPEDAIYIRWTLTLQGEPVRTLESIVFPMAADIFPNDEVEYTGLAYLKIILGDEEHLYKFGVKKVHDHPDGGYLNMWEEI